MENKHITSSVPGPQNACVQDRDLTFPSNETILFLGLDGMSSIEMSITCIKLGATSAFVSKNKYKESLPTNGGSTGVDIWHIQDLLSYFENPSISEKTFALGILPSTISRSEFKYSASRVASTQACALAFDTPG